MTSLIRHRFAARAIARLSLWLLLPLLFHVPANAAAEVFVIVNSANPQDSLSRNELIDLYTGRARRFATGTPAAALDLPRGNRLRAHFLERLTGQSEARINSYWSRLMFSGQVLPLAVVDSEDQVLQSVAANPSAISYVSTRPSDPRVKVVYRIED